MLFTAVHRLVHGALGLFARMRPCSILLGWLFLNEHLSLNQLFFLWLSVKRGCYRHIVW